MPKPTDEEVKKMVEAYVRNIRLGLNIAMTDRMVLALTRKWLETDPRLNPDDYPDLEKWVAEFNGRDAAKWMNKLVNRDTPYPE